LKKKRKISCIGGSKEGTKWRWVWSGTFFIISKSTVF
jgi:hypothetical protein